MSAKTHGTSRVYSHTPVAAAEPSAPNKAVSTATATFKIVFHLFRSPCKVSLHITTQRLNTRRPGRLIQNVFLSSFFLDGQCRAKEKRASRLAFLCLVPHARGRSQRRQYRCRHRCNDLHNPLKSLFLCHTLLMLMINGFVG